MSDYFRLRSIKKRLVVVHKIRSHIPFVLLSFTLCTIIPFIYVSSEHTIHSWDQTQYQDMTVFNSLKIKEMMPFSLGSIYRHFKDIYNSTGKNYSAFHTVLVSPMLLLFGPSRLMYVLSLSWFYMFPFAITIGAIAYSIARVEKNWAFRIGTLLAIVTPAVWLPTLSGYPDVGAAFLVCLAVWLFIRDTTLKSWWKILCIGSSLALAVLFRRHFAYDVITFFLIASLIQVYFAAISLQPLSIKIKRLLLSAIRVGLVAISMFVVLYLLGLPFLRRALHTNFSELYSSYERTYFLNLNYYLLYYGWIAVILAFLGPIWTLRSKSKTIISHAASLFILLAGIYSVVQWVIKVKQLGVHYTLHFTPWIILGIFIFIWQVRHRFPQQRRLIGLSFVALFACIFIVTLFPLPGRVPFTNDQAAGTLKSIVKPFPASFPPPRRNDYNEILRLSGYLQSIAGKTDPIYVVASSYTLNDDLLWHAHPNFHSIMMASNTDSFWNGYRMNILHWAPFADSYDNYPLQEMYKAKYIVTTKPFQHHLPLGQQKVMHVVAKAFEDSWEYSKDFELLPDTFSFADNVTVYIYKRVRPTTFLTLYNTYKTVQSYFKTPPGGKTDWIGLNNNVYYLNVNKETNSHDVTVDRIDSTPASLLYLQTKISKPRAVKGNISFSSPDVKNFGIRLNRIDEAGNVISSELRNFQTAPGTFQISFDDQVHSGSLIHLTVLPEKADNETKEIKYVVLKNLEVLK